MKQEIERKFAIKEMPDLSGKQPIVYERYYLRIEDEIEERIQKKGEKFEREIKKQLSDLSRTTEKTVLTQDEFEDLKKGAKKSISRDSYMISNAPDVTIKIYHGDFEGLVRAEVEFKSEAEARTFKPLDWMGREISNLPLGKDSSLIQLSNEEFRVQLELIK